MLSAFSRTPAGTVTSVAVGPLVKAITYTP